MASEDVLAELQRWYLAQSDGEWEHKFGVVIDTLDNPGWAVKIDLAQTALAEQSYERVEMHRSPGDWVVSYRDEMQWRAACGPSISRTPFDISYLGHFRLEAEAKLCGQGWSG